MRNLPAALLFVSGLCYGVAPEQGDPKATPASIRAMFTPGDDIEGTIRAEIGRAKSSIRMQAYSFTSRSIAQALVDAKGRGVDVRVVVDRSQLTARGSEIDFLSFGAVRVWVDSRHAIAHNKVIVIDDREVITGSYNYTRAAEASNAENVLILEDDERIAKLYATNWWKHQSHSDPYEAAK